MITRRGLIGGLGALFVASPAIVRATSLMPVKSFPQMTTWRIEGRDAFGNFKTELIYTYTDPRAVWGYLGKATYKKEGEVARIDWDWPGDDDWAYIDRAMKVLGEVPRA